MKRKRQIKFRIFYTIKRTLKLFLILALMGAVYSLGKAANENTRVNKDIEDFKSRAVFVGEFEIEYRLGVYQTRRYYEVPRETSYEVNDQRSVWSDPSQKLLGKKGDIFATYPSPFPHIPGVHQFITFYFGGHAAIHNGNGGFIEATGFPEGDETVWDIITHDGSKPHDYSVTVHNGQTNYWLNPVFRTESDEAYPYYGSNYRKSFIVLRVKDVTSNQIDQAVSFAADKADKALYNFLFFLDLKYKFYCTDLVSRAYQDALIPVEKQRDYSRALNDDGFITSVNDLVLSKYTYITAYVEIIDDITHIYYLKDI
jgi:hypothetical protein